MQELLFLSATHRYHTPLWLSPYILPPEIAAASMVHVPTPPREMVVMSKPIRTRSHVLADVLYLSAPKSNCTPTTVCLLLLIVVLVALIILY